MSFFEIPETPEFTRQIRRFETSDPAHADLFNTLVGALVNNDVFLRNLTNQLLQTIEGHATDRQNPHGVSRAQLGIDKVNNTSDSEKPVSTAQRDALDAAYAQSTGYTDQKIANLINGAPSTLDTLGEIAKAMQDNQHVVAALDIAIGKKADAGHIHDDRYYTETEINNLLGGKAASSHTHSKKQITDFPTALPASDVYSWAKAASKPSYSWSEIGSKPGTFPPSAHSHDDRYYTEAEVNSLLGGKAGNGHTHSFADITGKPALGQWVSSCGATTLATGRNVPLSAYISLSGWYFVNGMIRFATNDDSIDVGLYISAGGNGEYAEPWPGSQGARGVRPYTNLSTSRIMWINAGAYINLSCHAGKSCQLEGARIEYTLLCSY